MCITDIRGSITLSIEVEGSLPTLYSDLLHLFINMKQIFSTFGLLQTFQSCLRTDNESREIIEGCPSTPAG